MNSLCFIDEFLENLLSASIIQVSKYSLETISGIQLIFTACRSIELHLIMLHEHLRDTPKAVVEEVKNRPHFRKRLVHVALHEIHEEFTTVKDSGHVGGR